MSIIDRIQQIFRPRATEGSGELATTANFAAQEAVLQEDVFIRKFTAETERAQMVRTCREMYNTDPRAKKMISRLARDMVNGGFAIHTSDEGATAAAQAMYERLKLSQRLDDWARLTARDGDSFLEVVINDGLEIVDVSRKPTLHTRRNSNLFDQFDDPQRAYWIADGLPFGADPPKNAVWFPAWQILHARWEHDEGKRYGTPMLASGISAWKRVKEGELDISVRRKTRSSMRYLHVLEGADDTALRKYKEENRSALSSNTAIADFFSNRAGSLSVVQGDAHLAEIADVQHHIATWFTSGEVPMELIGYGEDLNRDVLGPKQAAYNDTLEQLREWVVSEILRPLVELQLLLAGYFPDGLKIEITWKAKAAVTAQDILNVADAAMRLRLMGMPQEMIWKLLARFIPGIDAETLIKEINPEDGDAGRFDNILKGFGGG